MSRGRGARSEVGAEREHVSSREPGGSGGTLPHKICEIWVS